tara:strand:+ start:1439 stop:1591 length:153 start_codon:yes stop_codon:yes gene_type:complete
MYLNSFLFVIAPISLFVFGVLFISYMGKGLEQSTDKTFKLIDEFEKKYIY